MGRRDDLKLGALSAGYVASLAPSWRRFMRATREPQRAQDRQLERVLSHCSATLQGHRYGLSAVTSLADFQDRVPIHDYEAYAEDIARVGRAEPAVLTQEPVRMLERSSGSSGGNKLIPYGPGLLEDFSAATGPWLFSMYARRPQLLKTRAYWSVSPAARTKAYSEGGLPIGFEDDTEYFGPVARWALAQLLAVPGTVARLSDMRTWRRTTVRHLLASEDLGFISVWSPTFLTRLMQGIKEHVQEVLPELSKPRAAAIVRSLDRHGGVHATSLWPRLSLISCWTDGHAARFVKDVQDSFPGVEIQPKGLLATEGVFSFPLSPLTGPALPGAVAALTSHLLELIDLQHPDRRPLPVHQAQPGGEYSPLLSTAGGLLRYHLKDRVRCVGRVAEAPLFRFEGKLDNTSDVCGEKLCAGDVERALAEATAQTGLHPGFVLLAPQLGQTPPRYRLYLDFEAGPKSMGQFGDAVEQGLQANHHYLYARQLGQLAPIEPHRVIGGQARYEAALTARGVRAGDIKPTPLDKREFWDEVFTKTG